MVFAESDVISHINTGTDRADIVAGFHRSIAETVFSLAGKIGIKPPVSMTGGVAKNSGVLHFLEQIMQFPIRPLSEDPQIIAALGAALLARKEVKSRRC